MKSHDPPRLRSDATTSSLLRLALGAQDDEPSVAELRGLASGLGISLVHPPVRPLYEASAGAKTLAAAKVKWISSIVGPALFGAATATAVLQVAAPPKRLAPTHALVESQAATSALTHVGKPAQQPPLVVLPELASTEVAPTALPTLPRFAPPAKERPAPVIASPPTPALADPNVPSPAVAPASEIVLLERAKAKVDSDPEGALALIGEHALRFPGGMMEQEAEVIAIEAMARAGQTRGAVERLTRFRSRFAGSAYLPHLENVVRHENEK